MEEIITVKIPVTATVRLSVWADEYGMGESEARSDIPRHLRELIAGTVAPHHRYLLHSLAVGRATATSNIRGDERDNPRYRPSETVAWLATQYVINFARMVAGDMIATGISHVLIERIRTESGMDEEAAIEWAADEIEDARLRRAA